MPVQRSTVKHSLRLLLLPAGLGLCNPAHAQTTIDQSTPTLDAALNPSLGIGVADRVVPGFERAGIQAGSFTIRPEITIAGFATNNIYATQGNASSAAGAILKPQVKATRTTDNSTINLTADGEITRYFSQSSNDYEAYTVHADGTRSIGSNVTIGINGGYRRQAEQRSDPGAITNTLTPILFGIANVGATAVFESGRFHVRGTGDFSTIRYDDARLVIGGISDQSYRDRNLGRFTLQTDYSLTANIALRVQASYARSDYQHTDVANRLNRSSDRYEILGGLALDFTDLLTGAFGIGYIKQNYDDSTFRGFSGIGARAQLRYQPTRLTTVTFKASRTINEAGLPLAPSYLSTNATLQVDHELFRSLTVSAYAGYQTNKFHLPDRSDRRPNVGASATYRMNRNVSLVFQYDYLKITSHPEDLGRNLSLNSGSIGINVGI